MERHPDTLIDRAPARTHHPHSPRAIVDLTWALAEVERARRERNALPHEERIGSKYS